MPKKVDNEAFDKLRDLLDESESQGLPEEEQEPWSPSLSKTQQEIFDCTAQYILISGNRGSGKTFGVGHKLVRHLYENWNALAVIIVGVRSQATQGGIWDKLELEIFPAWKEGIGLEYKEEQRDTQQFQYRMVRNRHGGWSKVVLLSMPWKEQIHSRIRGFEPSLVFVDELTTLGGPAYFDAVVQQLGRRPGIDGPQQYIAATNPDGPSHWVYKRFFEVPWKEARDRHGMIISREGKWDTRYKVFTLQVEENKDNLNPDYYQRVVEATREDPIEYKRMVEGVWVDRPTGNAIFAEDFVEQEHLLKRNARGQFPAPSPRFPVVLGYDLGQTSNAIIFMQPLLLKDKGLVWLIFDEILFNNRKIPYETLVKVILRKMQAWQRVVGRNLEWYHVSDDSAFNQYRAGEGSYDNLQVLRFSRIYAPPLGLKPIQMVPAPKFQGSKEARVRLTSQLLREGRLLLSEKCEGVKRMFFNLESEKIVQGKYDPAAPFKPKRSVYLHPFDAMTYPFLEADLGRPKFLPTYTRPTVEIISKNAA